MFLFWGRDEVWVWGEGSHCFLSLNAHSDAMAVLREPQKEEQQKSLNLAALDNFSFWKKKYKEKEKTHSSKIRRKKKILHWRCLREKPRAHLD